MAPFGLQADCGMCSIFSEVQADNDWIVQLSYSAAAAVAAAAAAPAGLPLQLCSPPALCRYNPHGVQPAQLLIRNNDGLFPAERGRDLASQGVAAKLRHRALDGATTHGLERQLEGLNLSGGGIALVTGDACIVHCNLRAANGVWVLPHSWAAERGLGSAELRLPAACRTSGRVCPAIACLHPCRHVHQIQCQVQLLLPEAAC